MKWLVLAASLAVMLVTSQGAAVSAADEAGGERLKRSGDLLGYIGTKIGNKISSIASASASLSSQPKPEYEPPPPHEEKSLDFWTFKKALLSTLLQAVKAIKGGIIALKGQLIKAKGNLLTSKGRLISSKGEAISNFGKQLASSALMLDKQPEHPPVHPPSHPPSGHSSGYSSGPSGSSGFESTGSHTEYGGPPPPSASYGIPSGPATLYGSPFSARASSGTGASTKSSSSLPGGAHAGLLVIKPIPTQGTSSGHTGFTSNLHDFFASGSRPIAAIVAAPTLRRSDMDSFMTADQDFSVLPEFSSSYDF